MASDPSRPSHWLSVGGPTRFDREFTQEEFNAALDLMNKIKGTFAQNVEEGPNVIEAFGLSPELGNWAARVFKETMAVVSEHGGQLEDIGVTLTLDGIFIGLCLSVIASRE